MDDVPDPGTTAEPSGTDGPGDIPAERPAALSRLDALVGEWEMEALFEAGAFGPDSPPVTSRGGRTTFHWLEGEFFLIQRSTVEASWPSAINDHRR
jgi:hypothetical protein